MRPGGVIRSRLGFIVVTFQCAIQFSTARPDCFANMYSKSCGRLMPESSSFMRSLGVADLFGPQSHFLNGLFKLSIFIGFVRATFRWNHIKRNTPGARPDIAFLFFAFSASIV